MPNATHISYSFRVLGKHKSRVSVNDNEFRLANKKVKFEEEISYYSLITPN
jgi:hypothetical protein